MFAIGGPDIAGSEKNLLRELGRQLAEIAALPIHREKEDLWRRLNGLERVRPLVNWHMEDLCWPEVLPDSVLEAVSPESRRYERYLRRKLYQWHHIRDDKVLRAEIPYETVIRNSGIGIVAHSISSGAAHGGAVGFERVLKEESDIERIKMPEIEVDHESTRRNREICHEIFGGILEPVTKVRPPWDFPSIAIVDLLATLRGMEQFFFDLIERPGWVHEVLEKLLQANLHALKQYEDLNLLGLYNTDFEIGTSALGFTSELPGPDFDGIHVQAKNIWGFSASQVFVSVGNDMHEEFATAYDRRYLEHFGLNVVGCCEPLERKMDLVRTIPNLRVISMSEWVNRDKAAEVLAKDYVFAYKPTGAWFAADTWDLEAARGDLEDLLKKTRNCVVEIHHNACSTCRNQPERIQEWVDMAMELCGAYA